MLIAHENIYCGIFDSSIARKNISKSDKRTVGCFELEFFNSSRGVSYIDDAKYPIKKGMFICAKPGQIRHSEFPVKCNFIRIFEDENTDNKLVSLLKSLPDCTYLDGDFMSDEILPLASRLGSCFSSSNVSKATEMLINSLFYEILYKILGSIQGNSGQEELSSISRVAREAYEYINENFTSDCSLKTIAEVVNISPNYLHTVFRESFGVSPYQYTVSKRIEKAKKLIMVGEVSMLDIALSLGFCSQSHFNRIFKEQTGETPTVFRKRIFENY